MKTRTIEVSEKLLEALEVFIKKWEVNTNQAVNDILVDFLSSLLLNKGVRTNGDYTKSELKDSTKKLLQAEVERLEEEDKKHG